MTPISKTSAAIAVAAAETQIGRQWLALNVILEGCIFDRAMPNSTNNRREWSEAKFASVRVNLAC